MELRYKNLVIGHVEREVDGYYVFYPSERSSYWTADMLQFVADTLNELNREWDEKVQKDLSKYGSRAV